jgi:hypothetical protein
MIAEDIVYSVLLFKYLLETRINIPKGTVSLRGIDNPPRKSMEALHFIKNLALSSLLRLLQLLVLSLRPTT